MKSGRRSRAWFAWLVAVVASVPGPAAWAKSDDPAAALTRLGYAVRDAEAAGAEPSVLILSDVHDPAITGATLDGLDALRRRVPFETVGLENYDHDFRNLPATDEGVGPVRASLDSILRAADPELVAWAREVVRRRNPPVGPAIRRYLGRHRALAFGMEAGDSSMLFLRAAFLHGELLSDSWQSARDTAAARRSPLNWQARHRGLEALGPFLSRRDPSTPRVFAPSAEALADSTLFARSVSIYGVWFNRHVFDERNAAFVAAVQREMAMRRAARAVVVVGFSHTRRAGEWPSLQERLRASGLNVIVADPPAVRPWLAGHPEAVASSK